MTGGKSHLVKMDVANGCVSDLEELPRTVSFRPTGADDSTLIIKQYSLQRSGSSMGCGMLLSHIMFIRRRHFVRCISRYHNATQSSVTGLPCTDMNVAARWANTGPKSWKHVSAFSNHL